MGITSTLIQIEKKPFWTLLGLVLALVFGGVTVYSEFIRDRHPILQYEVISDASVLDVREKLSSLEIVYGGVDIQKAGQTLRMVVVRVANKGISDILKGHYDEKSPLGIRFSGCSVLRAEIINTSNPYLKNGLSLSVVDHSSVLISPVILEASEWFSVKTLVLCQEGTRPTIQALGKIAGVKEITIAESIISVADPGFISKTFSGDFLVQIARLVGYFFGLILLVIIVIYPVVSISTALGERKRRKNVEKFKRKSAIQFNDLDEKLFKMYVSQGAEHIRVMSAIVVGDKSISFSDGDVPQEQDLFFETSSRRYVLRKMRSAGFFVKKENKWVLDQHFSKTLHDFVKFLSFVESE